MKLITFCVLAGLMANGQSPMPHNPATDAEKITNALRAGPGYFMFKHLKNAQLILYPDSGHGALFQYASLFVDHSLLFLSKQ